MVFILPSGCYYWYTCPMLHFCHFYMTHINTILLFFQFFQFILSLKFFRGKSKMVVCSWTLYTWLYIFYICLTQQKLQLRLEILLRTKLRQVLFVLFVSLGFLDSKTLDQLALVGLSQVHKTWSTLLHNK